MYPREYTWMSDPTKVMSSAKAIESWSTSSDASAENDPAVTKLNRCTVDDRFSASWPSIWMKISAPTTNDPQDSAVASTGPKPSVRRPPKRSSAAPSMGSAMSSHANDVTPLAACTSPACVASPAAYVPDVSKRYPMPVDIE
jgi:hypothetical protein